MSVINTKYCGCHKRLYENNSIPIEFNGNYYYYCSISCIFKHIYIKIKGVLVK